MAVVLIMLEAESVVKDEITLMINEKYVDITLEKVILTSTSYARDIIRMRLYYYYIQYTIFIYNV